MVKILFQVCYNKFKKGKNDETNNEDHEPII